jgi:uncharacterized protein (TIGR03435 family)
MAGLGNWVEAAGTLRGAGPALANHLWQSTAFAGVAAGLALALKKNHARARYWIWMSASVKLLLPFALFAGLASHWVKPRATAPVNVRMYSAVEDVSEPFSLPATPAPAVRTRRFVVVRTQAPAATNAGRSVAASAQASGQAANARPAGGASAISRVRRFASRARAALPVVLGVVWFAGFASVLGMWCVRWRRVALAMREAVPLFEGREVAALRRTELAAEVWQPIELRESAGAMEPGVFGIVRPVLAWPAGISERLDDAQLEAILAHEVCHVRRRDNLTAALHMVVEAVFWFHPMVWWMGKRLVEERERACDEEVLLLGRHPEVYAESILKVCEFCVQSPLECVSGVTGADLKQRVIEIMTARVVRKLTLGKKLLLAGVAMLVAAVPIVLGQAKATQRLESMIQAPKPVRAILAAVGETASVAKVAATRAMIPGIETSSTATLAEVSQGESDDAFDPCAAPKGAEFDVISIKPSKASSSDWDSEANADGVALSGTTKALIQQAFSLRDFQIAGDPDWAASETFDIRAKFDVPDKGADQAARGAAAARWKERYRSLLRERFQFRCHMTMKELPVYDLVVAKGGSKLKPTTAGSNNSVTGRGDAHKTQNIATAVTSQHIVAMLARLVGRTVIDKTGLTDRYDFTLNWSTQRQIERSASDGEASLPELPTAVEEQLGLKLIPSKGSVPVLVIDHIEKPSVDGAEVMPANLTEDTRARLVRVQDATGAPAPALQVFHFPQATLSSRGKKADGPGIIDLPQPGFGAEITLAMHGATDWLQSVQVISRSVQNIVSVRIGWAYVLPTGAFEFHQGDVETVQGGASTNNNFQLRGQNAAVRTDVRDFIAFVEQVTLKDGTVLNADHAKIVAMYGEISGGKAVARSKAEIDPNSTAAQQGGLGPHLTPGLKPISFDVVSFRRTQQRGNGKVDLPAEGDYIAYHGVPIDALVRFAHIARKGYVTVTGEPEWAKSDLYEFTAKVAPEDIAEWKKMSLTDKRAMIATLLADALKLKVHQNTEPQPVYDLVVAKNGPKLTEYQPGDTVKAPGGQVLTGKVLRWFDPFTLVCQDTTIADLVNSLSGPDRAGRVVVDKTGLNGAYNFTVPIPYSPLPQQIMEMSDGPSFNDGLKSLGLQMVKSTGVIDQVVVDELERPTEN